MRVQLRRLGNSSGVIIPKPILTQLGVEAGDSFDLLFRDDCIVLTAVKGLPRTGWAEAAQEIAGVGDDALVWPEFGNVGDEDLCW